MRNTTGEKYFLMTHLRSKTRLEEILTIPGLFEAGPDLQLSVS